MRLLMTALMQILIITAIAYGMIMVVRAFILKTPADIAGQDLGKSDSQPFPELLVRKEALKQTSE